MLITLKNKNTELSFVMPYGVEEGTWEGTWEYSKHIYSFEYADRQYNNLLSRGIKPEIARDILPLSLATDFVFTANIRALRDILAVRNDKRAHPHMIELAGMIEEQLRAFVPIVFEGIHE